MKNYISTLIVIALLVVIGVVVLWPQTEQGNVNLGSYPEIDIRGIATSTTKAVYSTGTQVLADSGAGRVYFRITNIGGQRVTCHFVSTSTGITDGTGIVLSLPGNTTSTPPTYYDSGEARINYTGQIWCITPTSTYSNVSIIYK